MSKKRLIPRATSTLLAFFLAHGAMPPNVLPPVASFAAQSHVQKKSECEADDQEAESFLKEALKKVENETPGIVSPIFDKAFQLWVSCEDYEKAGNGALQMGDHYVAMNKYAQALYYYKCVLPLQRLSPSLCARALHSIGASYGALYEFDLAFHYYEREFSLGQKARDLSIQITALAGEAEVRYQQRDDKAATEVISRAQKFRMRNALDSKSGATLEEIRGRLQFNEGAINQARGSFERTLAIRRRLGERSGEVIALCLLSLVEIASGQHPLALEHSREAVRITDELINQSSHSESPKAKELRWHSMLSLARAQRAMGDKSNALGSYKSAIFSAAGTWRMRYTVTDESATGFSADYQSAVSEYVDLLVEKDGSKDGFEELQRARAKTLQTLITTRKVNKPFGHIAENAKVRECSRTIARLRTEIFSSRLTAAKRERLKKQLEDAERARDEARIEALAQTSYSLEHFQPIDLAPLQEYLKAKDESVAEFMVGKKRSLVFFVGATKFAVAVLPGRAQLEAKVREFLPAVTERPADVTPSSIAQLKARAAELFRLLFGDVAKEIREARNLMIVRDGILHRVPFDVLVQDDRYLVEDHRISYLVSAGMVSLWQDSDEKTDKEGRMDFLGFGDPMFGPENKRSASKRSVRSSRYLTRGIAFFNNREVPPLKRTRDELEDIAKLFQEDRRRVYLGKDATEDALKHAKLSSFRRIHIATHNLVDESSPSHSVVLFTLDDDPSEDGYLEVSEVWELDLDADLVVLSACQTGRGQLIDGEGIVGLSRAFLYAGARAVAVSLWNISDISTSHLMKDFYQELSQNVGNAEALRNAKLLMLRSRAETRHPYYWGSFVITGKP